MKFLYKPFYQPGGAQVKEGNAEKSCGKINGQIQRKVDYFFAVVSVAQTGLLRKPWEFADLPKYRLPK
ncbi:MAG: hypothetical protein LBB47_05095 [Spirochaetaceae bacterium]|jgi:hypothetical protein|nr:hypothetical protein [Spirochaetaceae bacterium]